MLRLPAPSIAGEEARFNNRDYVAFNDSGTLVWEHDHSKFIYIRDWCDHDLDSLSPTVGDQQGYFEVADMIIQWSKRPLVTGNESWTFPKPFTSTAIPGVTGFDQRTSATFPPATQPPLSIVLYSLGTNSVTYACWGKFELRGPLSPSIITIAQQTGVVVPDEEQVPATFTPDEIDWNGRHMTEANDGSKDVWFINRRAYAYVDDKTAAAGPVRYLSAGNMLINMEDFPAGSGVRTKTWNQPFGNAVTPVIAAAAVNSGSRTCMFYQVNENDALFKATTVNSSTGTSDEVTGFAIAALHNPYPNPIRWPVPNFLGEKFHYRRQFYVAELSGGSLVWAMDLDARFDLEIEHITSPDTAERLDLNSLRLLAGPVTAGSGNRIEVFDAEFGDIPRVGPAVSTSASNDRGCNVSAIQATQFTARAYDWGAGLGQGAGTATSDPIWYIAAGLKPDALIAKLIAYWTLDGSGSGDKEELLGSGWDFRSAAGADSMLAVKQYGARQDSVVDPAMDKWFNLETLAWHNTGNAYFDGQSDFGISFWFYPDSSGTGTVGVVLGMSDDGSPIEVVYDDATGTTINLQLHDVNTAVQSSPTVAVVVDEWNFLYFGWTSATKTVSVILNDNARSSSVVTIALPFEELNDGEPLTLLRRTDDTDPVRGALDELGLWKADLSDAEVARLYNEGFGTQGPDF